MAAVPESFVHYLAAWNERDPERIRAHLERSVAPSRPARAVVGMDCTTVDEDGLITRLEGFFGEFPRHEAEA